MDYANWYGMRTGRVHLSSELAGLECVQFGAGPIDAPENIAAGSHVRCEWWREDGLSCDVVIFAESVKRGVM